MAQFKKLPDNIKQANDSLVLFVGVTWLCIMTDNLLAWGIILGLGYLFNLLVWYVLNKTNGE